MKKSQATAAWEWRNCVQVTSDRCGARLRKWIDLTLAQEYIHAISTLVDIVVDPAPIEAATRDLDDGYLVALAREHSADFIVTGDKDFLEWEDQTPPAITPAAGWGRFVQVPPPIRARRVRFTSAPFAGSCPRLPGRHH